MIIEYKQTSDDRVALPTSGPFQPTVNLWARSIGDKLDCPFCGHRLSCAPFVTLVTGYSSPNANGSHFHVHAFHKLCEEVTAYGASRLPSSRDKWCVW